jgi:putative AlgH/UPF0301 family transcriptional regulator
MSETLRGQLLVAAPILHDPNFHRTVVLVAEHGEEGAMGLVLNRPTDTAVGDALPELALLAGEEDPVYVGGPVALESVLAVAELDDPDDASELLFGTVGFVQDTDVPVSTWATPAGAQASSRPSSRKSRGSSSPPSRTTSSATIPTASGARCSAVRAVRTHCSR